MHLSKLMTERRHYQKYKIKSYDKNQKDATHRHYNPYGHL